MKKPKLMIDDYFCWGCQTCEVACKQEHRVPAGVKLIEIRQEAKPDKHGGLEVVFRSRVCRHCDDPPCVPACPVEAITQREDGIVVLRENECSGCEACLEACPYGAIAFDEAGGVAQKCNLCYERVDSGLLPACADNVCLGHCIRFGDEEVLREMPFGLRSTGP